MDSIHSPTQPHHPQAAFGLLCGLGAYASWGVVPMYFKLLKHVPPMVVLAHRISWSILFLLIVIAAQHRWREILATLRSGRTLLLLAASTTVLAINWFVFIWAMTNNQVISASLGYFINPLVAVMLGMIFLRERMRPAQTVAIVIATIAVATIIVGERRVPVVALSLAFSFGTYGLLRKVAVVAPLVGLLIETALLIPIALPYAIAHAEPAHHLHTLALLALSGIVTAVPLLWFAAAARRLRLSTLGFLQYLAPTCQFLLGRFLYGEPFSAIRLIGFSFVWVALLVFTVDSIRAYRLGKRAALNEAAAMDTVVEAAPVAQLDRASDF